MDLPARDPASLILSYLKEKPSVSFFCAQNQISRKTFYKWLKRYQENSLTLPGKVGRPAVLRLEKLKELQKLAIKGPNYSQSKLAEKLGVSKATIHRNLKEQNLDRRTRLEDRKKLFGVGIEDYQRHRLAKRANEGEEISSISKDENLSRKTVYKWINRVNSGRPDTVRPTGKDHWRYVPGLEEAVNKIVVENPYFSAHRIASELKNSSLSVSSHGVHNLLLKLNLNRVEQRIKFALNNQEKAGVPVSGSQSVWKLPLRLLRFLLSPFAAIPKLGGTDWVSLVAGSLFSFTAIFLLVEYFRYLFNNQDLNRIGVTLASLALFFGVIFLVYSLKYYLTIVLVLRKGGQNQKGERPRHSLDNSFADVSLTRFPFVSIHVPFYNEARVAERILTALSNLDYPNYEVIVADDSTDATTSIIEKFVKNNPRIKISHRPSRAGYKGAALTEALKKTDSRAEFIAIFDADFIPFPDTLEMFVKYFFASVESLDKLKESKIAAVQGYQWHVLNKSENWITRGVRTEYAGSYVMERAGSQIYGGIKQIAGSVFMIRRDVLEKVGWGTSITEDFELTLKLYEAGYKIEYTPFIQTPSECVSTVRRLIRQRMRWAEGHTHNIRKMFIQLLTNPRLNKSEKLEFLYISPYYLQAAFFLLGTFFWLTSEIILRTKLPYFNSALGWSLIMVNFISLPLMNVVGLFMEESEERDYVGIASFVALSYIVAPFQAWAAVKGLIENKEGPWFRTPKTGRITDVFGRSHFSHLLGKILPWRKEKAVSAAEIKNFALNTTAGNRFNQFQIRPRRIKFLGRTLIAIFLVLTVFVGSLALNVPTSKAAANQLFLLSTVSGTDANFPSVSTSKELNATANSSPTANTTACTTYGTATAGTTEMFFPTSSSCGSTSTSESAGAEGWFYQSQSGQYPSGSWSFTVTLNSATVAATTGNFMLFASVYVYNGSTYTKQFYSIYKSSSQACSTTRPARTAGTAITPSTTSTDYTWTCTSAPLVDLGSSNYIYVEYFIEINTVTGKGQSANASVALIHNGNAANNGDSSITTTTFGVPEMALVLLPVAPFLPKAIEGLPEYFRHFTSWVRKKRKT